MILICFLWINDNIEELFKQFLRKTETLKYFVQFWSDSSTRIFFLTIANELYYIKFGKITHLFELDYLWQYWRKKKHTVSSKNLHWKYMRYKTTWTSDMTKNFTGRIRVAKVSKKKNLLKKKEKDKILELGP